MNYSIRKQMIMHNLENEYNQSEEKKCTFSPKTNKGKIKCKFIQNNVKEELFDIKSNDSKNSYWFINNNIYQRNNNYIYPNKILSKSNPTLNLNNNAFKRECNYFNKLIKINDNHLLEKNNFNKTSRNFNNSNLQKVSNNKSTNYISFNNILNKNEFNPTNNCSKNFNSILIKNEIKNTNENSFYRSHTYSKKFYKVKVYNNNINKSYKHSKKTLIKEKDNNSIKDTNNKSLYNLYNMKENNKILSYCNKTINSLKKFNKIVLSPSLSNKNKVHTINYDKILNNTKYKDNINNNDLKENKDNEIKNSKKAKSICINNNQFFNALSSSFSNDINKIKVSNLNNRQEKENNCNHKKNYRNNSKELIKEEDLYNYFNKTKANTIDKNEYYYTFRKGVVSYYSFNSTKRPKDFQNSNRTKPLIDIQKKGKNYSIKYNPNISRTNSIYLNNYNKKICRIKKDTNIKNKNINCYDININYRKGSLNDLVYKKDSLMQISNANFNTNNDTKGGCSISSSSLYPIKSHKENQSFRNSSILENNNSISISVNKKNNLHLCKRKTKQNIRKYINAINDIGNIIQYKEKGLNYYNSNNKNKENKNNNLEIDSNVVNECYIHNYRINNKNNKKRIESSSGKNEKSMTLQSLNDSKILELAEHIINNGDDSLEKMDIKLIELKKNFKKEKEKRDITFG